MSVAGPPVFMAFRFILLAFLFLPPLGSSQEPQFLNAWAVHVPKGGHIADALAARHGFVNLGQVCFLTAPPSASRDHDDETDPSLMDDRSAPWHATFTSDVLAIRRTRAHMSAVGEAMI